ASASASSSWRAKGSRTPRSSGCRRRPATRISTRRPSSRHWRRRLRALACPASLKGVLSPVDAAAALAEGVRRVDGWTCDELPVADGGEGTADVLDQAVGGEWRESQASDPLGRPVTARWLSLPDRTAVVESAQAVGLGRLAESERDPLVGSTAGLGELLVAVLVTGPAAVF